MKSGSSAHGMTEPMIVHTLSGQIDLHDIDPSAIHLIDIARGLAATARYRGQTRWSKTWRTYSVAEHSVLVSHCQWCLGPSLAAPRWALLHDAPEAYLHDVIRPIRRSVLSKEFFSIERKIYLALSARFGLGARFDSDEILPGVTAADDYLLESEIEHLTTIPRDEKHLTPNWWLCRPPWSPEKASKQFLRRAKQLDLR